MGDPPRGSPELLGLPAVQVQEGGPCLWVMAGRARSVAQVCALGAKATAHQLRRSQSSRELHAPSAVAAGKSPTGRSTSFLVETVVTELRPLLVFRVAPTEDVSLEGHAAAAIHGGADLAEPRRRRIHRPVVDGSFPDEEGPPALCLSILPQRTSVRASRADLSVVVGPPDEISRLSILPSTAPSRSRSRRRRSRKERPRRLGNSPGGTSACPYRSFLQHATAPISFSAQA